MQSNTMFELIVGALSGPLAANLARRLGTDEATVRKAIKVAVPVLIAALARKASTKKGAASLSGALASDHDGSVLDDLGAFLGGGDTADGEAILGHVLSNKKRAKTEAGISDATGMDSAAVAQLMALLAPLVLGYLGRQQREKELGPGGLGDLLRTEEDSVEQSPPDELGGFLDVVLDRNQDGDVKDDAIQLGMGALRKWLAGRG